MANSLLIIGDIISLPDVWSTYFRCFFIVDTVGILLFMGGPALDSLIRSMFDSIGLFTLTPVVLFLIMGEQSIDQEWPPEPSIS
jgi:hypothetical protein